MNMAKSRQIRLPGLESDSEASPPESRLPQACEFPDTPPIAEMGVGREEQPAEPVEAEIGDARLDRQDGLRGRFAFADLSGVPRLAGNDEAARRADRSRSSVLPAT